MADKYRIVRMYADPDKGSEAIREGVTLAAAKRHCRDPETSSATCGNPIGLARTERHGQWFDGYERETA